MNFEQLLVRCKAQGDWNFDAQHYDYIWVEGYIAPVGVSDNGVHFGIYTDELKNYAYLCGSGEFAGTVKIFDCINTDTI